MFKTHLKLLLIFLLSLTGLQAQPLVELPSGPANGWDCIRRNDHITARRLFTETLAKDSADEKALEGMIFLSELEGDNLSYRKYVRRLLNTHWDEGLYDIFKHVYNISSSELLKKPGLSQTTKINLEMAQAEQLQSKGEDQKAVQSFRRLTDDFEWSVIGPFNNLNGSGYAVSYPVESSAFKTDTTYAGDAGMQLKWVPCRHRNPDGSIYFSYYLNNTTSGVYYANTFIANQKAQRLQFRIGRSAPMKLWVDNKLIFAQDETVTFGYDNEWVTLDLPAGTHRLMLKYAMDYETNPITLLKSLFSGKNMTASSFQDPKAYSMMKNIPADLAATQVVRKKLAAGEGFNFILDALEESEFDFPAYRDYDFGSQVPVIRITDTSGNLVKGISSSFSSTGAVKGLDISDLSTTDKRLIRLFKDRLARNENDLFGWYTLQLAYIVSGLSEGGEETFVKAWRKHADMVFFRYLAAQMYQENGKKEHFYEVLNNIDQTKTPLFSLLYEKFLEKDQTSDEEEWLAELNRLDSLSPSNYDLIKAKIKYYDDKGMKEDKESYIARLSQDYPAYKKSLQKYRDPDKQEKQKGGFFRFISYLFLHDNNGDEGNSAAAGIRPDYLSVQALKEHGSTSRVLSTYDRLISSEPYNVDYRKEKAEYLLDQKKYDLACKELNKALELNPYSEALYEALGDVKKEMDAKDSALFYYKKAKLIAVSSFGSEDLDEKIEKIQDQKPLKKIFGTRKFEDILADTAWKAKYKNEDAVILMYTRDLLSDEFNHVQVHQQFMVKIQTDAGVNKWTEYDFSFLGNINSARIIKAKGGEVVPDMQGGLTVFKDLAPGDIIEIDGSYEWQPSNSLDNALALVTYMSFEAPVYYDKFSVIVPKGRYLGHICTKLADNLKKETRDSLMPDGSAGDLYTWEYSDVNKVVREDATLDDYDLYGTIMISNLPDWSKVANWYSRQTYKKLDATYEIKEVLDSIIKPEMSQEQKVQAIYNYLTKDIKYSFVPFLQSGYTPKRCGLTLSSHIGDCKDVATVMIAMLRQVGIESYYTLVKSNMFDHQRYLPSQYFDHVVAGYYLGGKLHFLDMTTDFYPHYVLTEGDVNAYALLIKDGEKELIQLPSDDLDPEKGWVSISTDARLSADRAMELSVKANYPGIAGGGLRENLSRITSESEQKSFLLDRLGKNVFQNVELRNYKMAHQSEITDTLSGNYDLAASLYADRVGGKLLVFRVPFMNAVRPAKALMSKVRYNRLDVSKFMEVAPTHEIVNITLPKGYRLLEVPKDVVLNSRFGEYSLHFSKTAAGIRVEKKQHFLLGEIAVDDYNAFKNYYLSILDADAGKLGAELIKN